MGLNEHFKWFTAKIAKNGDKKSAGSSYFGAKADFQQNSERSFVSMVYNLPDFRHTLEKESTTILKSHYVTSILYKTNLCQHNQLLRTWIMFPLCLSSLYFKLKSFAKIIQEKCGRKKNALCKRNGHLRNRGKNGVTHSSFLKSACNHRENFFAETFYV